MTLALCLAVLACAPGQDGRDAVEVAAWRELVELELFGQVIAEREAVSAPERELARDGEACALLARALFETRGPGAALTLLDEVGPRATPETAAFVHLERARCLIELDQLEEALAELGATGKDAPGLAPERPESWLLLGRAHARRGQLERARAPLERFVELAPLHPEGPSALYVLAQEAVRRGDGDAAQAWSGRGRELGEWLAYLRVRRLQVRENPDEPLPRLGLAMLWMRAGDLERADAVLDELLARFPEHASAWFHRGEVDRMRGDLAGARAAYDRAVELDADEVLARFNRAVIARMQGRQGDARRDFQLLVESAHADDPRLLNAHLELARLLRAAGDADGARERYEHYRSRGGRAELRSQDN